MQHALARFDRRDTVAEPDALRTDAIDRALPDRVHAAFARIRHAIALAPTRVIGAKNRVFEHAAQAHQRHVMQRRSAALTHPCAAHFVRIERPHFAVERFHDAARQLAAELAMQMRAKVVFGVRRRTAAHAHQEQVGEDRQRVRGRKAMNVPLDRRRNEFAEHMHAANRHGFVLAISSERSMALKAAYRSWMKSTCPP